MDENHQDKAGNKPIATEDVRWVFNRKSKLWLPKPKKPFAARMGVADKAPWDFIQLLLIPLVLAGVGYWFSAQQNQTSLQMSERQHQTDQQLATDQRRETTLQTYLDDVSDLLLKQNLAKSKPGDEVSEVARERTLTTLRRLDAKRNRIVLKFLRDAHLIGGKSAVVDFNHADLSYDDLSDTNLSNASLDSADLYGADLNDADLSDADLRRAKLSGANLSGAHLSGANLSGAKLGDTFVRDTYVHGANLSRANLLEADLSEADLRGAKLDKTILKRARYNTKEILMRNSQGNIIVKFPPTQWPQGFDPKAAGATEKNTYP